MFPVLAIARVASKHFLSLLFIQYLRRLFIMIIYPVDKTLGNWIYMAAKMSYLVVFNGCLLVRWNEIGCIKIRRAKEQRERDWKDETKRNETMNDVEMQRKNEACVLYYIFLLYQVEMVSRVVFRSLLPLFFLWAKIDRPNRRECWGHVLKWNKICAKRCSIAAVSVCVEAIALLLPTPAQHNKTSRLKINLKTIIFS